MSADHPYLQGSIGHLPEESNIMTSKDLSLTAGDPPSEVPMPDDPQPQPSPQESPQPVDPKQDPVTPEMPEPENLPEDPAGDPMNEDSSFL
jgi:hypothetical protein